MLTVETATSQILDHMRTINSANIPQTLIDIQHNQISDPENRETIKNLKPEDENAINDILHTYYNDNPTPLAFNNLYEQLVKTLGNASTNKANGEYYTPQSISTLISALIPTITPNTNLKPRTLMDPTVGMGNLLLVVYSQLVDHHYLPSGGNTLIGEELNPSTYRGAEVNLHPLQLLHNTISLKNGDTLSKEDYPTSDVKADLIIMNPPYSVKWDSKNNGTAKRFTDYPLAPDKAADYQFIIHALSHLKQDGLMFSILTHGVLSRGNKEEAIRKQLIQDHKIKAIISLPENMFINTSIPVTLIIWSHTGNDKGIMFIDASHDPQKENKLNVLNPMHYMKIPYALTHEDIEGYSHLASYEEIEKNDYNLNIPRYVMPLSDEQPFSMGLIMHGYIPWQQIDDTVQLLTRIHPHLADYCFTQVADFPSYGMPREKKEQLIKGYCDQHEDEYTAYVASALKRIDEECGIIESRITAYRDVFPCVDPFALLTDDPNDVIHCEYMKEINALDKLCMGSADSLESILKEEHETASELADMVAKLQLAQDPHGEGKRLLDDLAAYLKTM